MLLSPQSPVDIALNKVKKCPFLSILHSVCRRQILDKDIICQMRRANLKLVMTSYLVVSFHAISCRMVMNYLCEDVTLTRFK